MAETIDERPEWRLRPWLLAGLGAAAGLAIHLVLGEGDPSKLGAAAIAFVAFIGAAAILIAFTLERERWRWALVFAGVAGATIGLVFYWNGGADDWGDAEGWRTVCAFLAVAIAAPLFQAARDAGRARFDYVEVHGHVLTNIVLWFAGWAFVGAVFLTILLLSELFRLIGIDVIKDLLEQNWFIRILIGAAFGTAIGVFRERDKIVRLLQRVAVAVLAVLAPLLGAGLLLFLLSLPFTGLGALWDATKSTTPILLSCVIGALILVNAVVGSSAEEESKSPPLRFGAMALALAMLPPAVIAAVSTGSRIAQYGYTPDRLWALVFVIVACAFGLAYLVSLGRGRLAWAERLRPANLKLAFGLCAVALFLALPILSFNAIATRDQIARLESGRISPDKFDWAALAYDFGEPGKRALAALKASGSPAIAAAALAASRATNRFELSERKRTVEARDSLDERVRVLPEPVPLPPELRASLVAWRACGETEPCIVLYRAGATEAITIRQGCVRPDAQGRMEIAVDNFAGDCAPNVSKLALAAGTWRVGAAELAEPARKARNRALAEAFIAGRVEVRDVVRRQVFVGGEPSGEAFE